MNLRLFALLLSLSPNAQAGDVPSSPGVAPISSSDPRLDPQRAARGYVGAAVCGDCHQTEFELWQGSHHQLAMTGASADTVLGDFDDAEIEVHGVK